MNELSPSSDDLTTHRAHRIASSRQAKQLFFVAAFMSFALSVYLFFNGDTDRGIFVGLWVPSILSAGTLMMLRPNHD